MSAETLLHLLPEIILATAAVGLYLAGSIAPRRRAEFGLSALAAVAVAAAALLVQGGEADVAGDFEFGPLARFGRWFALGLAAVLLPAAWCPDDPRDPANDAAESAGSLLLLIVGMMLACSAGDLAMLFVSLELVSIPTYILLYIGRRGPRSAEAAAKYFFLSILASAIVLYGMAFLYGAAGSTQLGAVRDALTGAMSGDGASADSARLVFARLALVLLVAGLSFKVAAVPFHFYAPDVYQGASYANAALLSAVPKAVGLLVMARLLFDLLPGADPFAWRLVMALSILTMTFANLAALWQDDLRRLLGYSAVAHAGYMLVALAAAMACPGAEPSALGLAAMLLYLVVYAAAAIGLLSLLGHLGRADESLDGIDELAGLGRTRPVEAALAVVFLFSLAGVPPLAGFWGKLGVFFSALSVGGSNEVSATIRPWFIALAIIGALNAAVAAAYYLRVVAVMYFRTPLGTPRAEGGAGPRAAAVACAVVVLWLAVAPGGLWRAASWAGASLGRRPDANIASDPGAPERHVARATDAATTPEPSPPGEGSATELPASRAARLPSVAAKRPGGIGSEGTAGSGASP